jgi:hypothetical protein
LQRPTPRQSQTTGILLAYAFSASREEEKPRAHQSETKGAQAMHPDLEGYLWITIKAFGFALIGIYATRIALHAYEALKWGV